MTDGVPRSQLVLYAAAALVIALLGAKYLGGSSGAPGGPSGPAVARDAAASTGVAQVSEPRAAGAVVHVAGAVRDPGVYRLRAGERIDDAIRRAGGATARADLSAVNLAAKVEDGRQVLVPERARAAAAPGPSTAAPSAAGAAGAAAVPGAPGSVPVNLNTATLEQLDTLTGVGPATAQKILAYREEHGGFGSVDELAQVPGIGDARMAALKDLVTV